MTDDRDPMEVWPIFGEELFYGLDGEHLTMMEWAKLMEKKHIARRADPMGVTTPEDDPTRIGSTKVGNAWVSTVWLGLDHSFGRGPPLIFETMLFEEGSDEDRGCWRYATREAALAGHNRVVICLENGWDLP